jgi:ribosome-associated translation inhibitor RaiA
MQIEVSTDNHINGSDKLTTVVEELVTHGLSHFASHITRVEVHLADENGDKPGPHDKRCTIEARVEGRKPTVATAHGDSVEAAVRGASKKLASVLESELGRLEARH